MPSPPHQIESWPIDKPIPYARNPRKNDASVDVVASSIAEFVFMPESSALPDRLILPRLPIDELSRALEDYETQEHKLDRMLVLKHDPRRFLVALACANTARAVYADVGR